MQKLKHRIVGALAVAAAVLGWTIAASAPAEASAAAEAFVQSNVQRGLQILSNSALSKQQQQEQFREFLLGLTDLRRIALYTLGPARRSATPQQQEAFVEA